MVFANGINKFAESKFIRCMSLAKQLALLSPVYVPLILSVILLAGSRLRERAKMWLSAAMLNASMVFLGNYLYFSHNYHTYSYLHSLHIFSVLAVYPSVYIYVLLLTRPGYSLRSAWRHFVPGLVFFVLSATVFYFFLTPEQRVYFLSTYRLHPTYDNFALRFLFWVRYFNIAALFVQIVLYAVLIYKVLAGYRKQLPEWFSDPSGISLGWMRIFNATFILAAFLSISFYSINPVKLFGDERYLIFPLYLFAVIIWILGILGNNQKEVFTGKQDDGNISDNGSEPQGYEKLSEAMKVWMEMEKPYLKPDLKIWDVSLALHTNRTYLSRMINQLHKCNFSQYVNRYRVEHSKTLLREGRMNLEETAQSSGFGSVSTLIRAFREVEGTTPKQWMRQNADR